MQQAWTLRLIRHMLATSHLQLIGGRFGELVLDWLECIPEAMLELAHITAHIWMS